MTVSQCLGCVMRVWWWCGWVEGKPVRAQCLPWKKGKNKGAGGQEGKASLSKGAVCVNLCEEDVAGEGGVAKGCGPGCSRRGQPTRAGALPVINHPRLN